MRGPPEAEPSIGRSGKVRGGPRGGIRRWLGRTLTQNVYQLFPLPPPWVRFMGAQVSWLLGKG